MGFPGQDLGPLVIHPWSRYSLAGEFASLDIQCNSSGWVANRSYFTPFYLPAPAMLRRIGWGNGATSSGNVDAGLFRYDGTRLRTTGSTPQAGSDAIQTVDVVDIECPPGLYYMAIAFDNTTGNIRCISSTARILSSFGVFQQSAFPLPSTFTPATLTDDNPLFPFLIFGRYV